MSENKKTFKILKEKKGVPEHVKASMKADNKIKKTIKKALKEKPLTINEIAENTGLENEIVTYYLMTMIKYDDVVPGQIDEMDEYYFYTLKK